jgi:hypothetical protein
LAALINSHLNYALQSEIATEIARHELQATAARLAADQTAVANLKRNSGGQVL